jgi:5S rRNA maturation endonuclease (ribonuclease M5)
MGNMRHALTLVEGKDDLISQSKDQVKQNADIRNSTQAIKTLNLLNKPRKEKKHKPTTKTFWKF